MHISLDPSRLIRVAAALVVCCGVGVLGGCRQEPASVGGLITLDGKPLEMADGMRGSVVFQPTDRTQTTLNGLIDDGGRYELSTGASREVKPGAYWVAVSAVEIVPASEEHPEPTGRRITPAKYASATDSGFRVEVAPGVNKLDFKLTSDESPKASTEHAPEVKESAHADSSDIDP